MPGISEAIGSHFTVFRDIRKIGASSRQVMGIIALQILAAIFEVAGIFTIMPILQFIQNSGDVDTLVSEYEYWQYIYSTLSYFNLEIKLSNLLMIIGSFVIIRQVFIFCRLVIQAYVREDLVCNSRKNIFEAVMSTNLAQHGKIGSGIVANDISTEVVKCVDFVLNGISLMGLILLGFFYFSGALLISVPMTILTVLILSISYFFLKKLVSKVENIGYQIVEANRASTDFIVEKISNLRLLKAASKTHDEILSFEKISENQKKYNVKLSVIMAQMASSIEPIVLVLSFIVIHYSLVSLGISFESLAVFMLILLRLLPISKEILRTIQSRASARMTFNTILQLPEQLGEYREPAFGSSNFNENFLDVVINDLSFNYSGIVEQKRYSGVLNKVSFKVLRGEIVVIVGPSGSGKSTLLDLCARLITPESGSVLIGGVNYLDFSEGSFRNSVAYVPQSPLMLRGSIIDHVCYGSEKRDLDKVEQAAKLAGADSFIDDLPDKYETKLDVLGANLSGGQRQRVDLARALYGNAKIVLLDEPSSALDAEAEVKLARTIVELSRKLDLTFLIVAHSKDTIKAADKLVVLQQGRVANFGEPRMVSQQSGWYRDTFEN
ncbi:ABC transporter ATP-binding protein/permease [Paracoccaceae bacterium]|nr:ABC transporter ATP-binding protein/permease [Paracoccaceae bacterium]